MAESIFARISRILSAGIEDSVDHLEKAGGESVMREAIREADRAIDQVKAERDVVMSRRLQAARHQILLAKRVDALNEKARFAIDQGRDDLAEAALSRQIDFEAEAEKLSEAAAQAREEEARLEEGLAALEERKTHMEDALKAYLISQREAALGGDGPVRPDRVAEKKVDAAEQAFDRAMTGLGGLGMARVDTATVHRVAEIDALQRNAAIAQRLAALKAHGAA
jgi:phage shock protein A